MNELVVVERRFEAPAVFSELQDKERHVAWCLEQHAVKFLHSYIARDRETVICLYRAPDVEAVRVTQRTAGLPVERAWAASVIGELPTTNQSVLIAERWLEQPVTSDFVIETMAERGHCMQLYGVSLLASHLARDGRRMICAFAAPDAEAVRTTNHKIGFPVDRLWPGDVVL